MAENEAHAVEVREAQSKGTEKKSVGKGKHEYVHVNDCVEFIVQKYDGAVSADAVTATLTEIKKKRIELARETRKSERKKARDAALKDDALALQEMLQRKADEEELEIKARTRAHFLQGVALLENVNTILTTYKGREFEGLSALLVGNNSPTAGSRLSIDAKQVALEGEYMGGLLLDLQKLENGAFDNFKKGSLDLEVMKALWATDNPRVAPYEGSQQAKDIAAVIHKWQEKARSDANLSGAWIRKMSGYIIRQSHDSNLMKKAGYNQWAKDVLEYIDLDRTREDAEALGLAGEDAVLKRVYDNLTTRIFNDEMPDTTVLHQTDNVGSTAKKLSESRVLRFKSAEAFFEYNKKYGRGSLREAVMLGLQRNAQATVLMRSLGPSPQKNFDNLINEVMGTLKVSGNFEELQKIQNKKKVLYNQLKEVDGTLNYDANPTLANIGRNVRMLNNMARLGSVVITSMTDIPLFSAEMAYQGQSFLGSMGEAISGVVKGRGTREQQEILSSLGVFFDSMSGELVARTGGCEAGQGTMARMQNFFFRANLLSLWTDSMRKSAGLMMSHNLALSKGLPFEELSEEVRRLFNMYSIGTDEWELFRNMQGKAADGREYLTPDGIDDYADDVIAAYLGKKGITANAIDIENARFDLKEKLRTYYRDRINFAVLQPDAKTRAITRQGTSAGTPMGEIMRCVMQFKSFMVAYAQKPVGRSMYGFGATRMKDMRGNEWFSMAQMVLASTLFGYGVMVTKDLLKGKEPRKPWEAETWLAAAAQGGGFGIFGDFAFGDHNRFGGGFATSLMGPTAGNIDDISRIFSSVTDLDFKSVASKGSRFAYGNTPFSNLFYVRPVLDYVLMYNLYDWINPGYFDRMRRKVQKENEQDFFMSPVSFGRGKG